MSSAERSWSTVSDIEAKVRRRWADGSLLRAYAAGEPFAPIEVPLRGPRVSELGDELEAVRTWVARLDAGRRDDSRYELRWTTVGGRHFGRNRLPERAVLTRYDQAWRLLEVVGEVRALDRILSVAETAPAVRAWVVANPHRALVVGEEWPGVLAAYQWLDAHRGAGRYLREISAPGVDTKFAERHRSTLSALLGVSATASGFLAGLGLQSKPELVRLRPSPSLPLPQPLTEVAVRADELASLDIGVRRAVVVENEVTYLSVPVPEDAAVFWGKGFEVDRIGRLPWLVDADVVYWGDVDTHGFAILDRLRAWLPRTRSVLMDRETLLAHRDRWGVEERPATSRLTRLTRDERDLYDDLVGDRLGVRLRLEQERIDWAWALDRLPS